MSFYSFFRCCNYIIAIVNNNSNIHSTGTYISITHLTGALSKSIVAGLLLHDTKSI
jgi:hypothetical protein